ncbi:MAG: glycine--tRNA ligase subunit beta [bacterium]
MANYLVEIGVEELPYKFIPSAIEQLKELLSRELTANRIEYKNIKIYGTPRRLGVIIENIAESQPDNIKKIKGPPVKVAIDENSNLTSAGIGFARKQGINPENLSKEFVCETEYIFAEIKEKGKKTSCVLKDIIPKVVLDLQGSHFMRWGDLDIKFSRPIRRLVSLMDTEEVKIKIGNIESTRFSRTLRFSDIQEIYINSPDSYLDDLYKAQVIVDQEKRKNEIIRQTNAAAESIGGEVGLDPDLLEEVVYLVEYPKAVLGSFDKKYLAVPKEVIITVMASHQRYFPVFAKNNKNNLLNYFITISNNPNQDSIDNIVKGNERVIKARLDDAAFFYTEDLKKSLEERIEDLKGVTFQKGLGTVYDKTNRIKQVSGFICKELNLDKNITNNVERTAILCKADLVTSLVREFTELQGVIGADYAKFYQENNLVAEGIKEHYMPLSANNRGLANSITGQIVGISDKIDTICGVFSLGKAPTGSADPLGLRRAALGIISTLINKNININLSDIINFSISTQSVKIENKEILTNEIKKFIIQRLRIYLNENYSYDVIEAVLNTKDPLADLKDILKRVEILTDLVNKENYKFFHEAANRILRITKSEYLDFMPNKALFKQDIENELYKCAKITGEIAENDYDKLIKELENCIPVINKFFDEVLVMDPNPEIRQNRLSLLGSLEKSFLRLADFSKIIA